jgi:hypothetical protein
MTLLSSQRSSSVSSESLPNLGEASELIQSYRTNDSYAQNSPQLGKCLLLSSQETSRELQRTASDGAPFTPLTFPYFFSIANSSAITSRLKRSTRTLTNDPGISPFNIGDTLYERSISLYLFLMRIRRKRPRNLLPNQVRI